MQVKPKTLQEAVTQALTDMSDEDHSYIMTVSDENAFHGYTHHGIGRWCRNNWGLWDAESDLHKHFNSIGLKHADDMSGTLLACIYRQIHGKPWDVDGQVSYYRNFWTAQGINPDTMERTEAKAVSCKVHNGDWSF